MRRWTAHRKEALAQSVIAGQLSGPEACAIHDLTTTELYGWIANYTMGGREALKIKSIPALPAA